MGTSDDDVTKIIPQRARKYTKPKARRRTPKRIDGLRLFAVLCWAALAIYLAEKVIH